MDLRGGRAAPGQPRQARVASHLLSMMLMMLMMCVVSFELFTVDLERDEHIVTLSVRTGSAILPLLASRDSVDEVIVASHSALCPPQAASWTTSASRRAKGDRTASAAEVDTSRTSPYLRTIGAFSLSPLLSWSVRHLPLTAACVLAADQGGRFPRRRGRPSPPPGLRDERRYRILLSAVAAAPSDCSCMARPSPSHEWWVSPTEANPETWQPSNHHLFPPAFQAAVRVRSCASSSRSGFIHCSCR